MLTAHVRRLHPNLCLYSRLSVCVCVFVKELETNTPYSLHVVFLSIGMRPFSKALAILTPIVLQNSEVNW